MSTRTIDLSLEIAEELPCYWNTHMPFQHKTFNYFADIPDQDAPLLSRPGVGAYQTRWMLIDEHTGTHLDAPAHFLPQEGSGLDNESPTGSITVEKVPLDQLTGPAIVIDATALTDTSAPGTSPIIDIDTLTKHESQYGPLCEGDIVLFHTGWDRHYLPGEAGLRYSHDPLVTKKHAGWPAPDVETMTYLLDHGVKCVGIDAPSMGACQDGAPVHRTALSRGAVFIEGLTHLDQLPPFGASFTFAPLNVVRGTGAPGRAFAVLNDPNGAPE
ncbi:hypothetical protein ASE16_02405 [Leifsonia sp. Root227]|uniref:cyclase family protein n=1 Tax=Leifsonia sp. Root227 TaxID=1736496 RepID=UPI0006F56BE4|nr:cyclase family protein [Leifsonia sp. Root227]KRC51940.1 hypothetical protein ASE16_02405 [Leifsonia sp. Root227]